MQQQTIDRTERGNDGEAGEEQLCLGWMWSLFWKGAYFTMFSGFARSFSGPTLGAQIEARDRSRVIPVLSSEIANQREPSQSL